MQIENTPLKGLSVVDTDSVADERGSFSRFFCANELSKVLGGRKIAQINHSHTLKQGALRGLHFQKAPFAEMKLVRCIRGEIFDVAVDLRKGSSTFLQWFSQVLSAENSKMMIIPEGFAHGFQAMQADAKILYLHTELYSPEYEFGLNFGDPKFKINWPLTVTEVSDRDQNHPYICANFEGLEL
jgi:dTDP-4-dehydrorhamnose 3,5-epimerase